MTASGHEGSQVEQRPMPLEGIVVLDLGQIYQGPYAGFLMAMAGARVIKVEPLIGEPIRARGPNLALSMLNSGKESISLDLKNPDGLSLFHSLAAVADVVLVNFAPGVPERLGIGFEDLSPLNDRLIYAQGSGFGVREPDGSLTSTAIPAMDITVQAHSGAMEITGFEGDPPTKSGAAYIDFLGGTHLYGAITTALFERERTGRGRSVEVSMADAAYFTLTTALGQWHRTGSTLRTGNRHAGLGIAPYNVYRCVDGHVALITAANRHWRSVLGVIGREDLLVDERLSDFSERAGHIDEVDELVESWTSTRRRDDVATAFQKAHVPAAAVRAIDEVVRDPAQHERRGLQWVDHPVLGEIPLAASPIRWHGSPVFELEAEPPLGADTHAVCRDLLGLGDDDIAALDATGAVLQAPTPQ